MTSTKPTPIYRQVFDELESRIQAGELEPGERLPSERDFAAQYGISRMTVRDALDQLVRRGRIERRERSGNFVARVKIDHPLSSVAGFSDRLARRAVMPGAQVLEAGTMRAGEADQQAVRALGLRGVELIHRVLRRRTGNGEPLALEESFFPAKLCPDLLTHDLTASIYGLLRERYGLAAVRFRQELEPTLLDPEAATALEAWPDGPVLRLIRTAWDAEDRAIEFARDLLRADRLRFVIESSSDQTEALHAAKSSRQGGAR